MRKTYRSEVSNYSIFEASYIQKYLGSELREVLNPTAESFHNIPFSLLYVSLPSIEDQLKDFKSVNHADQCVFLTGLTGCGKSSILNYFFHIDQKIHIENDSLIIPFSFDNSLSTRNYESIFDYFVAVIRSASSLLYDEMCKLNISGTTEALYQYIKAVRPELLNFASENSSYQEALDALREKFPLESCLLILKYRLTCLKKIKNVVIIVDDIESVGSSLELIPIDIGLLIWTCLKNQPKNLPPVWASSIILSCRHYVYRMIRQRSIDEMYTVKSNITSQTLEAYPIDNEVNISQPAKLSDIVSKRIQALERERPNPRWQKAKDVIDYILRKVDSNFGELISSICINNIRKSLEVLRKIVLNKRWIQREFVSSPNIQGAFDIDISNYNLTHPCLLRALALGEGIVYDNTGDIPNIMANEIDLQSDLITLITLIAFMNKGDTVQQDWHINIDRELVERELCEVLPPETHQYIVKATNYLIMKRLLLRSKVQAQDDGLDILETNVSNITHVYAARSSFQLWSLVQKSSVLFELYSDDMYFDYDLPFQERSQYSVFDAATYERCLQHMDELIRREAYLRSYAHNHGHSRHLNQLIGAEFLTSYILRGLQESRNKYYRFSSEERYQNELALLKHKISEHARSLHS